MSDAQKRLALKCFLPENLAYSGAPHNCMKCDADRRDGNSGYPEHLCADCAERLHTLLGADNETDWALAAEMLAPYQLPTTNEVNA